MIIFFLLAGLILHLTADNIFAETRSLSSEKGVQVYVNGQEYSSVDEYQQQKIESGIEATMNELEDDDFDLFLKELLEDYSAGSLKDLSEEQLRNIIRRLHYGQTDIPSSSPTDPQIQEMQDIWDAHQVTKSQDIPLDIDPQKVKTIYLVPHEPKEKSFSSHGEKIIEYQDHLKIQDETKHTEEGPY